MELTSPGPVKEKLNLNGKHSGESEIIRDDLNFEYSDTLNSDNVQQEEAINIFNGDVDSSQDNTKCVPKEVGKKEKECHEIVLELESHGDSINTILNENSSHTKGSFFDTENNIASDHEDSESILRLKHSNSTADANNGPSKGNDGFFTDIDSFKTNCNSSDTEAPTSQQKQLKSPNYREQYSGTQPNLSDQCSSTDLEDRIQPKTLFEGHSNNELPTLKCMVNENVNQVPSKDNVHSDMNEILSDSGSENDKGDNGTDLSKEHLMNECEDKEKIPSQSNDSPSTFGSVTEEPQISAFSIIDNNSLGGYNIESEPNKKYSEISDEIIQSNVITSTDDVPNCQVDGDTSISEPTLSDPSLQGNKASSLVSNNHPNVPVPSSNPRNVQSMPPVIPTAPKTYDYLLKVLLVGDSDVGKQEIISDMEDGTTDSPFCSSAGAGFKTTIILIDGKRVKLQLWDTSGQGRFCTIIRSYSRGAQGILLVYDITNKWSFEGINRWLKEVDQHAPGIPKVLVGNRLHLAFKRQVHQEEAEEYAERNSMGFFEVSPLVNFNISETLVELARMALRRNGMERWNGRSNKVSTLYELCAHSIVNRTTVYGIDRLKLPTSVKQNLKSYAVTNYSISQTNKKFLRRPGSSSQYYASGSFKNRQSGGSPASSICNSLRRVHRNRQHTPLANTPADAANVNCGPSRKSCTIS